MGNAVDVLQLLSTIEFEANGASGHNVENDLEREITEELRKWNTEMRTISSPLLPGFRTNAKLSHQRHPNSLPEVPKSRANPTNSGFEHSENYQIQASFLKAPLGKPLAVCVSCVQGTAHAESGRHEVIQ